MECEVCGKHTDELYFTEIERAKMQTCKKCSTSGKFIGKARLEPVKKKNIIIKEMPEEELVDNFEELIAKKRKESGLTQEQLADKINETHSIIKKIERGDFHPSKKTAGKLERLFKIKLYQIIKRQSYEEQPKVQSNLSLGDIVKIKKK